MLLLCCFEKLGREGRGEESESLGIYTLDRVHSHARGTDHTSVQSMKKERVQIVSLHSYAVTKPFSAVLLFFHGNFIQLQ